MQRTWVGDRDGLDAQHRADVVYADLVSLTLGACTASVTSMHAMARGAASAELTINRRERRAAEGAMPREAEGLRTDCLQAWR